MNARRSKATDKQAEHVAIKCAVVISLLFAMSHLLLITLARVAEQHQPSIACAPAAALVPATRPTEPPYEPATCRPASEQAGELAAFYRDNF